MKFFKKKNLLNVLYAVLIALPLFSILGRVLYTQWNQNAKDSYSGNNTFTYYEKYEGAAPSNAINNESDIVLGNYYFIDGIYVSQLSNDAYLSLEYTNDSSFELYDTPSVSTPHSDYLKDIVKITINLEKDYYSIFYWVDENNYISFQGSAGYVEGTFIFKGYDDINDFCVNGNITISTLQITTYTEVSQTSSSLDNAFDYSISQFVNENDFGKLNFFTWFSDLFLSNNSVNNLYIHFVNWYLNYTLYVSLGYILWLVLMWFVSFIRRLLEKTSTYETGGF